MRTFYLIALLTALTGCASDTTRDTWRIPERRVDRAPHLQKNAVTGQYRVIHATGNYGFRETLIEGDSTTCTRYLDSLRIASEKEAAAERRERLIWFSWFNVIIDSAAAQTDRELKSQIDSLTKFK